MKLNDVFQSIINGKAILITGSGAHVNAKAPDGTYFPSGIDLARRIYKACGIDNPDNPYDLQDAADTYLERKSATDFIVELKKMLMVGQIEQQHKDLYGQLWQRVYTTNYDDVPLIATKDNDVTLIPEVLNVDSINEDILNSRACVYINGYIGNLKEESLDSEFRLSGKSYVVSNVLEESVWGVVFSDDLDTADCIVIVGLSLDYDLDIRRFICQKNVIDKIVFIERDNLSPDRIRKMERMGMVYAIGMDEFTKELVAYGKTHTAQEMIPNSYIYHSFEVNREKMCWKKASAFEVRDLLMMGEFNDSLWYREQGKYISLVYRRSLCDVIDALRDGCRVIYLHANLGNGKTVFTECLKHQLQKSEYQIFTLKEYYQSSTAKEVQYIANLPGKKIIIIENYYNFMMVLEKFALYPLEQTQFILTARTVLYDTRILEANDYLKVNEGQSLVVDLNKLKDIEIQDMNRLLQKNGFWGSMSGMSESERKKHLFNKKYGNCEFQGILVDVVQSTNMKEKIEKLVKDIKCMSDSYYEILILALLIKIMSLNLSANDMSKIMKINIALDARFIQNENVREILDFSHGKTEFKVKSAVTANMILKELDCNETIIKVLALTAKYADRYRSMNRYENVLKNIISYSHVKTFLIKSGQKEAFLINYYDRLKELKYYEKNTFFWLQYAIACANIGNYDLAQTYLDSAYSYFKDSEYTVPFQIDTQQARLYLMRIENEKSADVGDLFGKAHTLLMKPVVSDKDNEEKQIRLLKLYVQKNIQRRLPSDFMDTYKVYCAEAYNKASNYLRKCTDENKKADYNGLMHRLLRASVRTSH